MRVKVKNFIFAPVLLLILGITATIGGAILTITLIFSAIGIPVLLIGIIMIIASVLLTANLILTSIRALLNSTGNWIMRKFSGDTLHNNKYNNNYNNNNDNNKENWKSHAKKIRSKSDKDNENFASADKIIDVEEEEKGIYKVK